MGQERLKEAPSGEKRARFVEETIATYRRYATEFIERFTLCPWARRARLDGKVHIHVELDSEQPEMLQKRLREVEKLGDFEVILFVFPTFVGERIEFTRFVSQLSAYHQKQTTNAERFAMAAFHPQAEADFATPSRLIPFVRRSPHPTIQLIRLSVLESVRGDGDHGTLFLDSSMIDLATFSLEIDPTLEERIAKANLETLRENLEEANDILSSIHAEVEKK